MKALIKIELRLTRKFLLIWAGFVLLLCGFAYFEYLSLQDSLGGLAELMQSFPKILLIMFGVGEELSSPLGWYGCIYFWVAILTYSYAVYLGISCMAKERARGTAEYLFTKPLDRGQIVAGKALAGVCNLLILAVFSGLCSYLTAILPLGGLEQRGAAISTTAGMFLTEAVLFALALLIAGLAKSYKSAARWGAGMLLGFYGIYIAAGYWELPVLDCLTPLKYFDVYTVAQEGFGPMPLLLAAGISTLSVIAARTCWAEREV